MTSLPSSSSAPSSLTSFTFEIRETLSRTVVIKARSMEEAWDEVDRMYMECEVVLSADDFRDLEILWVE